MATQRYISTSFWDDEWIQLLDPSEKLLYLYLMTNPLTNISGVYKITARRIAFDTGFNTDTIGHIFTKFEIAGKAFRVGEYVALPSWPKHQKWEKAPKIKDGIIACLKELPHEILGDLVEIRYKFDLKPLFDTLGIPYTYPSSYLNSDLDLHSDLDSDSFSQSEANNTKPEVITDPKNPTSKPLQKEKKLPLSEREPENELEVIEKHYFKNFLVLFKQGRVSTESPVITNWPAIRKLENGVLKNIPVDLIVKALDNAMQDKWIVGDCGYSLQTILSGGQLNKLINSKPHSSGLPLKVNERTTFLDI